MTDATADGDTSKSPSASFIYITGTVTALASIITSVATIYALVFIISPNLKPPEKLGASIGKIVMEQGVTYQEYLTRSNTVDLGYPDEHPGVLLYIQLEIQGFRERTYGARLTLMDKGTNKPVAGKEMWSSGHLAPAVLNEKGTLIGWVGKPEKKGTYFVRVRIYDRGLRESAPTKFDKEQTKGLLDVLDSKQFKW